MNELHVVKIVYMHYMMFDLLIDECDIHIFSSLENAEAFLIKNNFVYGTSYYFNQPGWYHKKSLYCSSCDLPRLIYAEIIVVKLDADANDAGYEKQCLDYLLFK